MRQKNHNILFTKHEVTSGHLVPPLQFLSLGGGRVGNLRCLCAVIRSLGGSRLAHDGDDVAFLGESLFKIPSVVRESGLDLFKLRSSKKIQRLHQFYLCPLMDDWAFWCFLPLRVTGGSKTSKFHFLKKFAAGESV